MCVSGCLALAVVFEVSLAPAAAFEVASISSSRRSGVLVVFDDAAADCSGELQCPIAVFDVEEFRCSADHVEEFRCCADHVEEFRCSADHVEEFRCSADRHVEEFRCSAVLAEPVAEPEPFAEPVAEGRHRRAGRGVAVPDMQILEQHVGPELVVLRHLRLTKATH